MNVIPIPTIVMLMLFAPTLADLSSVLATPDSKAPAFLALVNTTRNFSKYLLILFQILMSARAPTIAAAMQLVPIPWAHTVVLAIMDGAETATLAAVRFRKTRKARRASE